MIIFNVQMVRRTINKNKNKDKKNNLWTLASLITNKMLRVLLKIKENNNIRQKKRTR